MQFDSPNLWTLVVTLPETKTTHVLLQMYDNTGRKDYWIITDCRTCTRQNLDWVNYKHLFDFSQFYGVGQKVSLCLHPPIVGCHVDTTLINIHKASYSQGHGHTGS